MTTTIVNIDQTSTQLNLDAVSIDPKWALRVPASVAIRRRVLPLSEIEGVICVACLNDADLQSKKIVEKYLERDCRLLVVDAKSLQRALDRVYDRLELGEVDASKQRGLNVREDRDAPVAICDELFQAAILRGASDIHLIPNENGLAIHLRVDGVLEQYRELDKQTQPVVVSRLKVLAGMDIAEKRAAQDGRITAFYANTQRKLEIRAASLPTRYGERMTLRLLANNNEGISLQSLGMNDCDLRQFKTASQQPHGLILLTGPTGSGKSTTLYVAIEHLLRTRGGNVITIEDPIEYEIHGASQVEIDTADKVNFSKALRSVLRHDPDVVMIGEIRDQETADTAIKAALTGHLVFSTAHTNTAAGVITRLIDMDVEPFLLAATLRLSVAQRLVRRLCAHCRSERLITLQEALMLEEPELAGKITYDPQGCISCSGKGFTGRIGLFEMLENTPEISKLIAGNANESLVAADALRHGAKTLLDDGISKVLNGTTTIGEIINAVSIG
jgi:general secretion pathway protein E